MKVSRSEPDINKQGLALAICFLMMGNEAYAARSKLRAGLLQEGNLNGPNNGHEQHEKHVIDQYQGHDRNHAKQLFLIKNAQLFNKSFTSSRMLGQMSAKDMLAIENAIQFGQPLKDLQDKLERKTSEMDAEDIVEKLGDRVPIEVVTLVRATKTQKVGQPFSEASITKARNILNGMVYDAQLALDQKLIECKTFELMNKGTLAQVNNDLARLASQISDLAKVQSDSRKTMAECDSGIEELDGQLEEETKAYNLIKAEDDIEMTKRKADVAIAEFILGVTICEDKKPASLIQTDSAEPGTLGIMKCAGDQEEFRFQDPAIEEKAQKALTPAARKRLERWLDDVQNYTLLQTKVKGIPDADDEDESDQKSDDEEEGDLDELDEVAGEIDTPHAQMQAHTSSAEKPKKPMLAVEPPPPTPTAMPPIPPQSPKPDPLKPPKCVLTKTNCGLLHDNMSILWGKWKDLVDELQAKMDQDAADFENLKKDLNQQKQTFVTAKGTAETSLAEAVGMTNSDVEEQSAKQKEARELNKKFNEVWGECKTTIAEIMFTDICGVLFVRGKISEHSTTVGCKDCKNQIVDCEVDDWLPGLCSVPCDDECLGDGTKKDGSLCGGTQALERKVIQKNNEWGVKCVPLTNQRSCGQVLCPVNCQMSPFSSWSKCTKECEQGLQSRTRSMLVKPKNGGTQCDATQEAQSCNTGSCTRDCTLKKSWTPWSPCSQACGGGLQERFKHIKIPTRGDGKCPKKTGKKRFQKQKCNVQPCVGDEKCLAKMDMILALDGSGSLRESGYDMLKQFTVEYIKRMKAKAFGRKAVRVGVIQFGNGQLLKDGAETTVSGAKMVAGLSSGLKEVSQKVMATQWEKGFTNLAQVFAAAETMQMSGRKKAYTQLVIISDGKPSFKFSTKNEAQKLKDKGVNIFFININSSPNPKDVEYVKSEIVSQPWQMNYLTIPGVQKLKREMAKWVGEALVQTCPKALSPSQMETQAEELGFRLIKEGMWCGETPGAKPNEDKLHEFMGVVASPAMCMELVLSMEGKYFSYGTETGKKPNNQGSCYLETAATDGGKCSEKWVNGPTNFYEVLPLEIPGEK